MSLFDRIARPVRIPAVAVLLLAVSAVAGNLAQWEQKNDLKNQANVNSDQLECRAGIDGYVDGLSISLDTALGDGLIDRVGANNDEAFQESLAAYREAVAALRVAKEYREDAVEVCLDNPGFDPAEDIPKTAST